MTDDLTENSVWVAEQNLLLLKDRTCPKCLKPFIRCIERYDGLIGGLMTLETYSCHCRYWKIDQGRIYYVEIIKPGGPYQWWELYE